MKNLILFDNDGTLVKGLGPYIPSLQQAINETFDREIEIDLTPYHGRTDRYIASDLLKRNTVPHDDSGLDRCLLRFGQLYETDATQTVLIPGVPTALEHFSALVHLGVLTGNVEGMGRKKLRLHDIEKYFQYNAFGNETTDRSELIGFAIARANFSWSEINNSNTIYVGDTILDIEAGLAAGVKAIGVTTGKANRHQFETARAYAVIDSISELDQYLE